MLSYRGGWVEEWRINARRRIPVPTCLEYLTDRVSRSRDYSVRFQKPNLLEQVRSAVPNAKDMKPAQHLKQVIRASGLSRRRWYRTVYLYSDHWNGLRQSKFARDGRKCSDCGSVHQIQCHHKTYRSIFNVTIDDLETLCQKCHAKEHRRLKKARKAKRKAKRGAIGKFDVLKFLLESA